MRENEHSAEKLLETAATELVEVRRGKQYGLWRGDTGPRLNEALGASPPFEKFRDVWIHTGDGGCVRTTTRFGEWAIDRLVERKNFSDILIAFEDEAARNVGRYTEASPVFGIQLDKRCELGAGVVIVHEPTDALEAIMRPQIRSMRVPTGTAMLRQAYTVAPAFDLRTAEDRVSPGRSVTSPPSSDRDTVRTRVRLACLLASSGSVELPLTVLQPDRDALFVAGEGNQAGRPFSATPLVSFPVEAATVLRTYLAFKKFSELDSLARSIDRLGRSRLAASPADRALELGIAAEIALMHGQGEGNAEITHKIGTRAAWLLGRDLTEREGIFADMKRLYAARSQAVHSGILTSSRSTVDLDAADRLVTRVLLAILELCGFPNWTRLAMGGEPATEAGSRKPRGVTGRARGRRTSFYRPYRGDTAPGHGTRSCHNRRNLDIW
jgi:hypothetical protein